MSLKQVDAFYELLISEPAIYEQYHKQCCRKGFFNSCHWDKSKIVSFAASLGYNFSELDLDQAWLEGEPDLSDLSTSLSRYERVF